MTTIVIGKADAGRTVAALLQARLRLSWPEVRRLLHSRRVRLGGGTCPDPNRRVRPGQRLEVLTQPPAKRARRSEDLSGRSRPAKSSQSRSHAEFKIVFTDAHIIVVDKPAGLTTVRHAHEAEEFGERGRRFLPPTLVDLLPAALTKQPGERIRAVHRLDRDTSGLVVLARTAQAERQLGKQFRSHSIERKYLALVRGRAQPGRIESNLVKDRGDGRRGSSRQPDQGQHAVTHVRLVDDVGDFSLVECRLETGRTHQVRIHLGEQGTPLCGERIYDRPLDGQPLPDASGATRPALHAAFLAMEHPVTGKHMQWHSPLPRDMETLLQKLRNRR
jgi:23S rRNA pseudouridine1911/1915/1917 synthase